MRLLLLKLERVAGTDRVLSIPPVVASLPDVHVPVLVVGVPVDARDKHT